MDYKTFRDLTFEIDNELSADLILAKVIGKGPIKRATMTFKNNKAISVVENLSLLYRYEIMVFGFDDIFETDSQDDITEIMIKLQEQFVQLKKPKKFKHNN